MYHNILTQKENPEHSQIKKTVKLLLEFIEIDSIYFSKHFEEPCNKGIITVIISKSSPHFYDDICEYAWKIFKSHPEFSFVIFDKRWIKDELKECNPFLIMNCSESQLVYSVTNDPISINIKKINVKQMLKKTRRKFQIFTSSSDTLDRDLRYYRSNNFLMAAYNMQQQFRYLFLSVSWFLTGELSLGRSLNEQQEQLGMFSNLLGNTFDPEIEEEWIVLRQLESACSAIQWDREIEPISAETVEAASVKLVSVKKEVGRLFRGYMEKAKKTLEDYKNK